MMVTETMGRVLNNKDKSVKQEFEPVAKKNVWLLTVNRKETTQ
jgi:hypothetical protein